MCTAKGSINEYEVIHNPLGPLQAWGDRMLPTIR